MVVHQGLYQKNVATHGGDAPLCVGFVIWLIENADNPEFKGFGAMLWFSGTVLFFIQSKYLANF